MNYLNRFAACFMMVVLAACNGKNDSKQDAETTAMQASVQAQNNGVRNEIIAAVKVSDIVIPEGNKPIECRNFRLRKLDVNPGGVVGIHSHENRPSILGVGRGEGMSIHSYGHDPVAVKLGSAYEEYNNIVHYALNLSKTDTLTIITFDFLDDGSSCNGTKYPQHTQLMDKLVKDKDPFYVQAPQSAKDETNHPLYSTPIKDIKFPEGKAMLRDRVLRVRKVTLDAGTTTGMKDFSNRPTYILTIDGEINVIKNGTTTTVNTLDAIKLINEGQIEIKNAKDKKASYFVMELWDPNDKDIL